MKLQTTTEVIKNNLGLLIVCLGFAGTIFSFGSDWKGLPSRLEKIEKDRVSDKEILIRIDERVKRLESLIIEGNKRQVELMRQGSNIVISNPPNWGYLIPETLENIIWGFKDTTKWITNNTLVYTY